MPGYPVEDAPRSVVSAPMMGGRPFLCLIVLLGAVFSVADGVESSLRFLGQPMSESLFRPAAYAQDAVSDQDGSADPAREYQTASVPVDDFGDQHLPEPVRPSFPNVYSVCLTRAPPFSASAARPFRGFGFSSGNGAFTKAGEGVRKQRPI